jgi:type I protein arginine methyltransferase
MSNSRQGYSIFGYGRMITDRRIDPYVRALTAAVKPGDVVLDIGTGTGFFAVLACRLGARKVYAIEPDAAIVIARQVAIDNGCADRIEFIQGISTQIDLPERADVIISDLRGVLPLYQQHIHSIADARHRLLAPDGILIPRQDTLWATLISDPEFYHHNYHSPWEDAPYGCNLSANRRFVTNSWQKHRLQPAGYIGEPQLWTTLDYTSVTDPNVKSVLTWTIDRTATIHGIGAWFDTTLYEGIGFSNAPDQPEYLYGNAFFPLSAPVALASGDRVDLTLQANLVGDDYIWSWQTRVTSGLDKSAVKANFQQSSFFAVPLSPQTLRQHADTYIPPLTTSAQIDLAILQAIAETKSLGEIAQQLVHQFPDRFTAIAPALTYTANFTSQYE